MDGARAVSTGLHWGSRHNDLDIRQTDLKHVSCHPYAFVFTVLAKHNYDRYWIFLFTGGLSFDFI